MVTDSTQVPRYGPARCSNPYMYAEFQCRRDMPYTSGRFHTHLPSGCGALFRAGARPSTRSLRELAQPRVRLLTPPRTRPVFTFFLCRVSFADPRHVADFSLSGGPNRDGSAFASTKPGRHCGRRRHGTAQLYHPTLIHCSTCTIVWTKSTACPAIFPVNRLRVTICGIRRMHGRDQVNAY